MSKPSYWRSLKRHLHSVALRRPQSCDAALPQTIATVREKLKNLSGYQSTFGAAPPDRPKMASYLAKSQSDLPSRKLYDSYDEAIIPLSTDLEFREAYHNALHRVRFGRLLEDLDTFAVWLAYKHTLLPKNPDPSVSPFAIVTGMVDRIDVENRQLYTDMDMRLRGLVSHVGESSAEALVLMEQKRPGSEGWDHVMEARFVMVAREAMSHKKAYLNPLKPDGPEEEQLFALAKARTAHRKQWSEDSLLKIPPNEVESKLIHDRFLQTVNYKESVFSVRLRPPNSVWMDEAVLKNVFICHPQFRNIHGKIFGGFLMKNAFELAWSNAWIYSGNRPIILSVDDIKFRRPVDIGSLLLMSARLVYTDGADMQIRVLAEVLDPATQLRETTNTFFFTFRSAEEKPVRTVIPKTYADAMLYLTGRRHYEASRHYRRLVENSNK